MNKDKGKNETYKWHVREVWVAYTKIVDMKKIQKVLQT